MADAKRTGLRNIVRKYRFYPNKAQEEYFAKCFGCVRFVYNRMLSEKKEHYSLSLCNAQLHLEAAYKNFFRDPSVGYPKYKRKHGSRASYTTNRVNGNIRIEGGEIRLPKVGEIRIRKSKHQ